MSYCSCLASMVEIYPVVGTMGAHAIGHGQFSCRATVPHPGYYVSIDSEYLCGVKVSKFN